MTNNNLEDKSENRDFLNKYNLVSEKPNDSVNIFKGILDKAVKLRISREKGEIIVPEPIYKSLTLAFDSLNHINTRTGNKGTKLQELLISSILMKWLETNSPSKNHYLAPVENEDSDVDTFILQTDKNEKTLFTLEGRVALQTFTILRIQVKQLFDFEHLHEDMGNLQTVKRLASLKEFRTKILPKIKEIVETEKYSKTILVLFLRVRPAYLVPSSLARYIRKINEKRERSVFLVFPTLGAIDKKRKMLENTSVSKNGVGSTFYIQDVINWKPDNFVIFTMT